MDVAAMMWTGPAVGGTLIAVLGIALWSLARDPLRVSRAHDEGPLNFSRARAMGAGAEGYVPRGTGDDECTEKLKAPLAVGRSPVESVPFGPADTAPAEGATDEACAKPEELGQGGADIAREVQRLVALATPHEQIACQLGIAVAEVRLLIGMQAARGSRHGLVASPQAGGCGRAPGDGEAEE